MKMMTMMFMTTATNMATVQYIEIVLVKYNAIGIEYWKL